MQITIDQKGDSKVAIVQSAEVVLRDVQDALDLMASVRYNDDCDKIILFQPNLTEDFFELKTRLAGDILQKFVQYHVALAIVGNFGQYKSKSLRDFIYECNKGRHVFFLQNQEEALHVLHSLQ